MQNVRAAAFRLAFFSLVSLSACGDDKAEPQPYDDEDAHIRMRDASIEAGPDAGPLDGGSEEASVEDGAVPDGSAVSECTGDTLELKVANGPGRPFSAAIHKNRVHVAYAVPAGGKPYADSTLQGLRYVWFDTTGVLSDPVDVVSAGNDDYNITRDPALVARAVGSNTQLDLFYTSNETNAYELFYKDLTANSAPEQQTSNAATQRNELYTVAAPFQGGSGALYSDETTVVAPGAVALLKGKNTAPVTLVGETDMHATALAFGELAAGATFGFVSSFPSLQDTSKAKSGIFAQALSSAGTPVGPLTTLSTQIGGRSQIDIATLPGDNGAQNGAVFFTEAPGSADHQLRFRELDRTGAFVAATRNLTSSNIDLHEFAVAPYSRGYVIAFRRTGGVANYPASIYLMFIDAQGNESGKRLVRGVTGSAGGLEVLVANDGRIVVVWADTEQVTSDNKTVTELRMRAARLTCL